MAAALWRRRPARSGPDLHPPLSTSWDAVLQVARAWETWHPRRRAARHDGASADRSTDICSGLMR